MSSRSRLRRVIFVAPIIQLVIFGYAVSTDVRNTSTFVVDHDKTRASRELLEAFMATFLVFQPTMLLSGFMFPVSSMPVLFQWLTLLNPLRHYLEIVRGIFFKGTGLEALWPQYLTLLVMGTGILWFSR